MRATRCPMLLPRFIVSAFKAHTGLLRGKGGAACGLMSAEAVHSSSSGTSFRS